ncbi:4'-phosphopantetheinyl transferase superfamily protein [Roseateles sp. YR242]|uniref:4'-phosphopantetheinyl transferase family protein n=1 Tax=Roseateles sp. YR242 TaxID=1855305 RepID=UPI0015A5ED21|nr:4'-phosphopantetheinyl transferase superfamily protein [Roseateles sp. YR242]
MALPATWLSATEQARWATFSTEARRQSFLAGRWLARQTVRRWASASGISGRGRNGLLPNLPPDELPALEVAASGACQIAGSRGVFVSISHHGHHVACAVADVPVGVDIEGPRARRRDYLALAETVHSPSQQHALAALTPAQREHGFLQAWTLKEAWLKARQRGLDFALMRSLEFDADGGQGGMVDVAAAVHGDVVVALAADPALPSVIEAEPLLQWRRYGTRRLRVG